ncbi:hypothetical protein, partial [Micromonospora noduli]|uniref:hypothetical protein n=1 Tax=Micromonospora noduli TaxID=709876 RepID=UPI0011BF46A1
MLNAPPRPAPATRPAPGGHQAVPRVAVVFVAATLLLLVVGAVHLTQGTSNVGALDLLRLATGADDEAA